MTMAQSLVTVPMAVFAFDRWIVGMGMMVVMAVAVVVFHGGMIVVMLVMFGQMQPHPPGHQSRRDT